MPANVLKPVVLKNGITVLRFPRPSSQTFVVGLAVRTGSGIELGNFPLGISAFIERMFWKGTDKHPSLRMLNQALEGMGGDFFSNTGRELMQFYLRVPSDNQHKAISMLAEIIQHSYFQSHDVEVEKQRVLEDLKLRQEGIGEDDEDLTVSTLYGGSGLGTPIQGTIESILTITPEHIIEYLAHQFNPKNCYLILSGNFDTKSSLELLEQEWNLWSPRTLTRIEPGDDGAGVGIQLPRTDFRQRGLPTTKISIGFLLEGGFASPQEDDEPQDQQRQLHDLLSDWSKLLVLTTLLGQGLSSRLWTKCVEDELLFESITSQLVLFERTGYVYIGGRVIDNSQFSFALESIFATLEALKKTTISINEFAKAKEYVRGKLIIDHEDVLAATIWHVEIMLLSGLAITKDDLLEYIAKVDANNIRAMAMDLFVSARLALTTLGTAKHSQLVDKLISKYLG